MKVLELSRLEQEMVIGALRNQAENLRQLASRRTDQENKSLREAAASYARLADRLENAEPCPTKT